MWYRKEGLFVRNGTDIKGKEVLSNVFGLYPANESGLGIWERVECS